MSKQFLSLDAVVALLGEQGHAAESPLVQALMEKAAAEAVAETAAAAANGSGSKQAQRDAASVRSSQHDETSESEEEGEKEESGSGGRRTGSASVARAGMQPSSRSSRSSAVSASSRAASSRDASEYSLSLPIDRDVRSGAKKSKNSKAVVDSADQLLSLHSFSGVPSLRSVEHYPAWEQAFLNVMMLKGCRTIVLQGPTTFRLAASMDELDEEERKYRSCNRIDCLPDANKATIENERRLTSYAYAALVEAVSKVELATSVVLSVPSPNAHAAWLKLNDVMFGQSQIKMEAAERDLRAVRQQKNEDIRQYATRITTLVNVLYSLGSTLPSDHHQLVRIFVLGIDLDKHPSFRYRKDHLLLKRDCSLEEAIKMACDFVDLEAREKEAAKAAAGSNQLGDDARFTAAHLARVSSKPVCFNCQQEGHIAKDCPNPAKPGDRRRQLCSHCNKPNHSAEKCVARLQELVAKLQADKKPNTPPTAAHASVQEEKDRWDESW